MKIAQSIDKSDISAESKISLQRAANRIARKAGHLRADVVILVAGNRARNSVVDHIPYGYRKNTTGEYVPNSYRANFGWKNTYYQAATTTVEIDPLAAFRGQI